MKESDIKKFVAKSKYKNLDWNFYTENVEEDCDPMNGDRCVVILSDFTFHEDYQRWGMWSYDDVCGWAFKK